MTVSIAAPAACVDHALIHLLAQCATHHQFNGHSEAIRNAWIEVGWISAGRPPAHHALPVIAEAIRRELVGAEQDERGERIIRRLIGRPEHKA